MPTQLQLRRGTTNQHTSFTGAVGEVTVNTTKKTAVVHDGATAGGLELLRADMSNVFAAATPTITSLNTSGNVDVGGNLTVTGTTTFNGGTITMGDADTDNVVFGADVNSNILPNTDNTFSLGSSSKKWSDVRTVLLTTTGAATLGSTLDVTGNVAVNTNKFTVNSTSGNAAIAGTLGVTGDTTLTGDLAVNGGDLTTSQTTFNLLNATATTLNIGGAATSLNLGAASGTTTVGNNLTVSGDLTVNGNTTTLSTSTLEVEDKNILIAKGAVNDAAADDAGIIIESTAGGNKSILWKDATDAFTSSEHIETAAGKTLALSGSSSGKTTINVAATASGTLTLPSATDTLVGKATTDILTNKSISLTTNTLTGTSAELATAISDETGTGLLVFGTSPTLTTPVISQIVNTGTLTLPTSTDTLVGRATTDTLTAKSISLTTNTITGTLAEFNTALSDDDFVSLTGTETLTNKTLTSPKIGTSILDTNGNELLLLTATASAVNELTLANAATANRPTISATGTDTNIGIAITPKGTGNILVGSSIVPVSDSTKDLGTSALRFKDLYLSGNSIVMGTTKIMMHADGYLQFNANSAGNYPEGSNVKVATAANGVAATTGNALAFSIALGG